MFREILWREPKFEDSGEKDYAMETLVRLERDVANTYMKLATIAWIPVLIIWQRKGIGTPEAIVTLSFHILQAIICLVLLASTVSTKKLQWFVFWALAIGNLFWSAGALLDLSDGRGSSWFAGYWILLVLIASAYLPMRSFYHNIIAALVILTMGPILSKYPDPSLGYTLMFFCIIIGQNFRIYTTRMVKVAAIKRYREQSRYIPRQVMMEAARTNRSILDVFSPSKRFCVCVCSDWRDFQNLSTEIDTTTLGQSLATYYNDIVDILNKQFPEGGFFLDWIADELSVVVFSDSEEPNPALVQQTFEFARSVLKNRMIFFEKNAFPSGIDIGISAGLASVGIFGQGGVAKATAFGRTPAYARHLQDIAKSLRGQFANRDRIVMNGTFAELAPGGKKSFSQMNLDVPSDGHIASGLTEFFVWPNDDLP